jgi:hypothetical protein
MDICVLKLFKGIFQQYHDLMEELRLDTYPFMGVWKPSLLRWVLEYEPTSMILGL